MQSTDSAMAQAECAAEAAAAQARSQQEQQVRQAQAKHFQETHSTTVGRDVCAGQKGEAGGGGPMRQPDAMLKE